MNINKGRVLNIIVFFSGAIVMILELVAVRFYAPYLGTSQLVWSSLIAIILGSLSIGYYIGGRLADKKASYKNLASFFLIAAILTLVITICSSYVLYFFSYSFFMSLGFSVIMSTLILFAPVSVILGMISPYALKLKLLRLDESGRTAGDLYALSTLGSIVGTLGAGFWLIPLLGHFTLNLLLVLALFILAVLSWLLSIKIKKHYIILALLAIFFVSFVLSVVDTLYKNNNGFIADVNTTYSRIMISDHTNKEGQTIRYWQTNPDGAQSMMYLDQPDELAAHYTRLYNFDEVFVDDIQETLMIGGAAYSYPKYFLNKLPQAKMTVVEIDPVATQLAKDYFFLQESENLNIVHQDARRFLNQDTSSYDVIYMDAFTSSLAIPYQLTTQETVKGFFNVLNEDGLLLTNIISGITGDKGKFLQAEYKTYQSIFPQVYIWQVVENINSNEVQNLLLIASKSEELLDFSKIDLDNEFIQGEKWEGELNLDNVPILTDAYAPVDYYLLEMAL